MVLSKDPTIKYADGGNSIQFFKSSDDSGTSFAASISATVLKSSPSSFPESLGNKPFARQAFFTSRYLCHTFYVVINIHAP
ncbi:MAG: hypothetical protein WDN75_13415 [Bacteroidota bacterium]